MPRDRITALLADRIGLDPASLGPSMMARALKQRMTALKAPDEKAYAAELKNRPDELQELIEELIVPETWFFRDEKPFVLLRKIAQAWRPSAAEPLFRALSFPCATGEEAYSIAITLLDSGRSRAEIQVDALDLSQRVLTAARAGLYGPRLLKHVSPEILARYFQARDKGHQVAPSVRESVHFDRGNLVDPVPASRHGLYRLIFCRNALIYLTPEARRRAIHSLRQLLAPRGVLVLGHSENINSVAGFESFDSEHRYALRKSDAAATPRPSLDLSTFAPPPKAAPPNPTPARKPPKPAIPHRDTPPSLPSHAAPSAAGTSRFKGEPTVAEASALANERRFDEAAELCERLLARQGSSAETYHLLGMIRHAQDRPEAAVQALERAVFLNADDHEALLVLALIAKRQGRDTVAERYRLRAQRAEKRAETP